MKVERSNLVAMTSILDRNGRRVANYLVDKSKDSLEREEKRQPTPQTEEAVVIEAGEKLEAMAKPVAERKQRTMLLSLLDITA